MKRFLAIGVLALCLMSSQIARADENSDAKIKAQMVENYLLWQEALKLQDAERIISFELPDYTSVWKDDGSVYTKSDANASTRQTTERTRKVYVARVEIKKMTIEPNRVVILSKKYRDIDYLRIGSNRTDRVTITSLSREVWVEYGHVWMLKRTEHLDNKGTFNGKSVA